MQTIRVVVLGDTGVGKTSLIRALQGGSRLSPSPTKTVTANLADFPQQNVRLQLWDFPGAAHRRTLTKTYYRHTNVVCFVYACDRSEETLMDLIKSWIPDAKQALDPEEPVGAVLIGSRLDLAMMEGSVAGGGEGASSPLMEEVLWHIRRITGQTPAHVQVSADDLDIVRGLVHTIIMETPGTDLMDTIDMSETAGLVPDPPTRRRRVPWYRSVLRKASQCFVCCR